MVDVKSRYRDSERYVKMEANYNFLKARSSVDQKGGANGDKIDGNFKDPDATKNYHNFEPNMSAQLQEAYLKIHSDACVTKFLQRFPDLSKRKRHVGTENSGIDPSKCEPKSQRNPFEMPDPSTQEKKGAEKRNSRVNKSVPLGY